MLKEKQLQVGKKFRGLVDGAELVITKVGKPECPIGGPCHRSSYVEFMDLKTGKKGFTGFKNALHLLIEEL